MPNWCSNSVVISHPKKAIMKKALKAWEENKFLSTFIPEPDYKEVKVLPTFPSIRGNSKPVAPESAWWDWRVQNWGCKWELETKGTNNDIGDGKINAFFDSPWSPPIAAYETLTNLGFQIEAHFYESGCAFCGRYTSEGGSQDYEVEGDSQWVKDNIPSDIDEAFNISENTADYEEQEKAEQKAAKKKKPTSKKKK